MWTRRDWVTAFGSFSAGAATFTDIAEAADNPAASVYDRTSSIRIIKLTATPVAAKVFIKLETNLGVSGWGEIDQLELKAAKALVESLFSLLEGENPTRIEHLWQKLYRSHRDMRGGPFMTHTIAGIDMALWDIAGKLWDVPVYSLLGGPTRDKIHVYPSKNAIKIGAGPLPFSITPGQIEGLLKQIERAREKLGPTGIIMFDAHCALPPPALIQFCAVAEKHNLFYLEEPAVPGNIEVFKRLKQSIRIPFAVGEQARTIWDVVTYLHEGCADILQIDCAHTGGITQVKKIATLGEAYTVPLAPHCVTTDLGMSASLHVSAAIPNFLIHEYYSSITPSGLIRKQWTVDEEGNCSLPAGPGLGCEIDETVLAELAANPRKWEWPTRGRLKDGSIADY